MRHNFIFLLLVLVEISLLARADVINSNSMIVDDIEYYIQTDKEIYNLGEDVEMLYRATNLREEEWTIGYTVPMMDCLVDAREEGNFNEVWYWSWNQLFIPEPFPFQLQPLESVEIDGTWPQINMNGSVYTQDHTQVLPGTYRISGVFYQTGTSVAVDVAIVPEPTTLLLLGLGAVMVRRKEIKINNNFFRRMNK